MKISKSVASGLVAGQAVCVIVAFLHTIWRLFQAFFGSFNTHYAYWYQSFLFEQEFASIMLLFVALAALAITAFFTPSDEEPIEGGIVESFIALIPFVFYVALILSIVIDFESFMWDGLSPTNLFLGKCLIAFHVIGLFAPWPEKDERVWSFTDEDMTKAVTKAIAASFEETPSEW